LEETKMKRTSAMTAALIALGLFAGSSATVLAGTLGGNNGGGGGSAGGYTNAGPLPLPATGQALFVPITPCRVVDTRQVANGLVQANSIKSFDVNGATLAAQGGNAAGCPAIPFGITAVAANVTVTGGTRTSAGLPYLKAWPAGAAEPSASVINFDTVSDIANGLTLAVSPGASNKLSVKPELASTHVLIDILGYYISGMRAAINTDGTVESSTGPLAVSAMRQSAGVYIVNFGVDVRACAFVATPAQVDGAGTADANEISVADSFDFPGAVFVNTRSSGGLDVDSGFHLVVNC
jgi:hypothetical protein